MDNISCFFTGFGVSKKYILPKDLNITNIKYGFLSKFTTSDININKFLTAHNTGYHIMYNINITHTEKSKSNDMNQQTIL